MSFPSKSEFFDATINPMNVITSVQDKALQYVMDNSSVINDDAGLLIAQELTYIKAKGYDAIHPDLKYKDIFAPSDEVVPAYANTFAFKIYDRKGKASRGSLEGETRNSEPALLATHSANVTYAKAFYAYTTEELEQAALLRTDLSQRKVDACFETIERDVNEMAFFGDKLLGVKGLLDESQGIVPVNVSAWTASTTAADILASVRDMSKSVFEAGLIDPMEGGYRLVLDQAGYNLLRQPFSDLNPKPIRQVIEEDYNMEVMWVNEFGRGVAAAQGVNIPATSSIMALIPKDNESVFRQDAGTFESRAPEADAFSYKVHMYKKFGGVVVTKPARVGVFYRPAA